MKKDTNLLDTQDVRAEAATALTPNATNGEKIKALRTAQGMSMAELSRRASMTLALTYDQNIKINEEIFQKSSMLQKPARITSERTRSP